MTTLYVETNLLMSVATGRDPEASDLLSQPLEGVRLAVPQVCFIEAFSALNQERKSRERFTSMIVEQVTQLERDLTSAHAGRLRLHLEQARAVNDALALEVEERLFGAIDAILLVADLIALSPTSLSRSCHDVLIEDRTDNLILHCILEHARANPTEAKIFLSGNRKDFGTEAVRHALQGVGITNYVAEAKQFLGWYRSQPPA